MPDLLDDIRATAARVSDEAGWVHIDHDRLNQYADSFPSGSADISEPDPGRTRAGDDETTASFVIALDAINFGSGYFPYIRKRPGMSGYFTIATSLRDHVDTHGPVTTAMLHSLDAAECARIFGQPRDHGLADELMQRFALAWSHLATHVDERHGSSFTRLVQAAERSAARLVGDLDRIPEFHDVASYHGYDVPLYKRAQITAYDLAVAFDHEGLGEFHDLHRLTMFADNLVPHVLRVDGVLHLHPELVERIERVEDIPSGSEPEVEIRAVALHAVELMCARLRAAGHEVTSGELDSWLWTRGAGERYKSIARHRTRCVYY
jgi:putative queuosine salvage protein